MSSNSTKTICEILFDNNRERVCYTGQIINGQVLLTLFKPKTFRGNKL